MRCLAARRLCVAHSFMCSSNCSDERAVCCAPVYRCRVLHVRERRKRRRKRKWKSRTSLPRSCEVLILHQLPALNIRIGLNYACLGHQTSAKQACIDACAACCNMMCACPIRVPIPRRLMQFSERQFASSWIATIGRKCHSSQRSVLDVCDLCKGADFKVVYTVRGQNTYTKMQIWSVFSSPRDDACF